jgi:mannose-6-phosphate isomerase-like protein (cupin superfamily)
LQIVRFPPDGRANAHKHDGHETAIYVLSGESGMWYGERLEQHLIARAGEFLYIPANMPHLPYNLSPSESCVAVIARTDPNDQESVVLLPGARWSSRPLRVQLAVDATQARRLGHLNEWRLPWGFDYRLRLVQLS